MNPSARKQGLVSCHACGSVSEPTPRCGHCHAVLHSRIPQSIYYAWVYLITACILFFPANLLPITYTSYLGKTAQEDTILSSIIVLWQHQSYIIALIIFIASIVTPFFKIAVLFYLLTHLKPEKPPVWQTKMYRFIHFIGRWSMIDVFVVALLNALIQGNLAYIRAGMGIFSFTGVVIFTMLATERFDIRILWDNYYDQK